MKSHNHSHFWVEDERLYESYETIRGLRYRLKKEVPGKPDSDNCDENGVEIQNSITNHKQQI